MLKKTNLIFKNNFKNVIKHRIQLISLVILVFLTSLVFTLMETSNTRIINSYDNFISAEQSNQHDFVVDFDNGNFTFDGNNNLFQNISDKQILQNAYLDYLSQVLKTDEKLSFTYDRIEGRTFYNKHENKMIKAMAINPNQKIDKVVVTHGMPLSFWLSYQKAKNQYSRKWIYLSERFAQANNIKVNDIIRLQPDQYGKQLLVKKDVQLDNFLAKDINEWGKYQDQTWFRVVGFAASADLVTPIIDSYHILPNFHNQGIAYVDEALFGLEREKILLNGSKTTVEVVRTIEKAAKLLTKSNSDSEIYYVGKFKNEGGRFDLQSLTKSLDEIVSKGKPGVINAAFDKLNDKNAPFVIYKTDNSYLLSKRVTFLLSTISGYKIASYIIIIVIMIITFFALVVVLKKQITGTKGQIGILRSLGYSKSDLTISYFSYPLMIALIGGITGYLIGLPGQELIMLWFKNYFNLPYQAFTFTFSPLFLAIFGFFLLLTVAAAVTCFFMMRIPAIMMINGTISNFSFKMKQKLKTMLTLRNSFRGRFRAALLSESWGKMTGVTLTFISATTILTISATLPQILTDNITYSYLGNNYKSLITYVKPTYNAINSFYKTFDPSLPAGKYYQTANNYYATGKDQTNMTDDIANLLEQYRSGQINAELYSPNFDIFSLLDLSYKNISKTYLLSDKITGSKSEAETAILKNLIISKVWSDYYKYGITNYDNKEKITKATDYLEIKDKIEELDLLRLFYLKYHNTIALDQKRAAFFAGNKIKIDDKANKKLFFSTADYEPPYKPSNILQDGALVFSNKKWIQTPFSELIVANRYHLVKKLVYDIYNWYRAYFVDNLQQAFIQGIYQESPSHMKTMMARGFMSGKFDFNILFGIIPYNSKTEDLGTTFDASYQGQQLPVFGLKPNNKTQQLLTKNHINLAPTLFNGPENGIIINTSMAKMYNLRVGQKLTLQQYRPVLMHNNKEVAINDWDASDITATDSNQWTNSKYLTNDKWKNQSLTQSNNSYVFKSELTTNNDPPLTPTEMSELVRTRKVKINNQLVKDNNSYTIMGITNQYGDAKAWVQETRARKVMGYDKTLPLLLQVFLKEWKNPYQRTDISSDTKKFIEALEKGNYASTTASDYEAKYNKFVTDAKTNSLIAAWKTIFENQYPLFNYKLSNDDFTADTNGNNFSLVQNFGDYSYYGLNGGKVGHNTYYGYKSSAIANYLPVKEMQNLQHELISIIKLLTFVIIILSLLMACIMIILTTDVIITENKKIISMMKIIGYSNGAIIRLVLSMYFPIIVLATILGFATGWGFLIFALKVAVIHHLVLPLIFRLSIPFVIVLAVYAVYIAAYLLSWKVVNKFNPLVVMEEN